MNETSTVLLSRIFLPCYLAAYILFTYTLPVATFKRKHGIDPELVQAPDPVMLLIERYRDGILAVSLLLAFVHAIDPALLGFLPSFAFMKAPLLQLGGMVLMLASLFVVRLGQRQLGESWRVGFDRAGPATELITSGIYAYTRNPIFVGLLVMVLGFFFVLPNAATLAIGLVTLALLQVRVLIEEQHLVDVHGEAYLEYCRATPRWLLRPALPAQPASRRTTTVEA